MMKLALLILAHKSPEQLSRLLCRMDDKRFDFFIHIDAKSDINKFKGIDNRIKYSNIIWVKNRIKTYFTSNPQPPS